MRCFRAPLQANICPLYRCVDFQSIQPFLLLWLHARFSILLMFYVSFVIGLVKICWSFWCRKELWHHFSQPGAALIQPIQQDHFRIFIYEVASGKLAIQLQTRQLNECSNPGEVEKYPTLTLPKVPIKKMGRPRWCLDPKITPHHVTAARHKQSVA